MLLENVHALMSLLDSFSPSAFIFDKDGTLIDTESIWLETYRRWLQTYGESYGVDDHRRMIGSSTSDAVHLLQSKHASLPQGDASLERLFTERTFFFHQTRAEMGVRLLSGVRPFLVMVKQKGIPLAMATNATRENTQIELEMVGLTHFFDVIITADDVTRSKPAPDIYLEVAHRLRMYPAQCLAFEDGIPGIQSAHAAGVPVIFIRDGRFGLAIPPEANATVGSFEELM